MTVRQKPADFVRFEFHPLANIFPLMEGETFQMFASDVAVHGVREPIGIFEGKILDGRNRYRASVQAEQDCPWEDLGQLDDPLAYVISLNLHRRHLDESQRSMVAARIATLPWGGDRSKAPIGALNQPDAAALLNVARRSVQRARIVQDKAEPEIAKLVDAGKLAVSKAASLATASPEVQRSVAEKINKGEKATNAVRQAKREALPEKVAQLPKGRYRVLYCDPPWEYDDARQTGDHLQSTSALHHYEDMSLDALKKLDVRSLAAPDAVMLMWATFPMLPEALELLAAWRFQYKQAFVWDKGHGALGNYHDSDAELLLIGMVGSCPIEVDTRIKQIQRIKRGRHSAKPEEWREIIDRLWPSGPRVELFRRGDVPANWKTWGAEAD